MGVVVVSAVVLGEVSLHLLYKLEISLSVTLEISCEGPKSGERMNPQRAMRTALTLFAIINSASQTAWRESSESLIRRAVDMTGKQVPSFPPSALSLLALLLGP